MTKSDLTDEIQRCRSGDVGGGCFGVYARTNDVADTVRDLFAGVKSFFADIFKWDTSTVAKMSPCSLVLSRLMWTCLGGTREPSRA
eukprot:2689525-Rhodomonas_salina.2